MKQQNLKTRSIFAQRLIDARHAKGWSQNELAWQLKMALACVSDWENDHHRPRISTLTKVAKVLDVRVGWLLGVE